MSALLLLGAPSHADELAIGQEYPYRRTDGWDWDGVRRWWEITIEPRGWDGLGQWACIERWRWNGSTHVNVTNYPHIPHAKLKAQLAAYPTDAETGQVPR